MKQVPACVTRAPTVFEAIAENIEAAQPAVKLERPQVLEGIYRHAFFAYLEVQVRPTGAA